MELDFAIENKTLFLLGASFILGNIIGLTLATRKKINLLDLVIGQDGRLSGPKLWENVALATGVWAFIHAAYTQTLTEPVWMIFLGAYTSNKLLGNWIKAKYSTSNIPKSEETPQ